MWYDCLYKAADHVAYLVLVNSGLFWYSYIKIHTRVVPKLMPPIYFHGNYTRYKEHNNTI